MANNANKTTPMRKVLIPLFLLAGFIVWAQKSTPAGNYYLKWECDSHQIEYKLSLLEDGSYELNTYTLEKTSDSDVSHNFENGTWRTLDNLVTFSSKGKKDFDEEYTSNLNGSIARFIKDPPSETSDQESKTVLIFDTSKIYCIEGLEFVMIQ